MAAANFESGRRTIQPIAEALGLADKQITAITIEVRGNDPAKVKVEMLAEVPGIEGVCTVLREYRLEPNPGVMGDRVILPDGEREQPERPPTPKSVKFREWT